MFTAGFFKTAYDTAGMMNRKPIMPSSSQAADLRKGMASGGPSFSEAMGNIGREVKGLFGMGSSTGKSNMNTGHMGG